MEWLYILTKLLKSVEIKAWNDYILNIHEESGDHVYMLKKERYNADAISKALGITVERFLQLDVVVLEEPVQNKGLPKPSVDYWGTA
jgi:hypothetical protein